MSKEEIQNNFVVRNYRDGDFPGISHFWDLTGMGSPERGDNELIIENTIKMGGMLLVLEEEKTGKISGTSWMTFDGRRVLLHHFGILPEYQGNGLSKILLKESLEFVRNTGHQVKLEVHSKNFKAISLYEKFGFRHLGDYNVFIIRDISNII